MKIIITENQYKLIKENVSLKEKLKELMKKTGFKSVVKIVGSLDNLFKIFDIKEPMDFLNIFNDLETVQSEEREDWTLYRFKKGNNIMIYNRKNEVVYINYNEIWSVLDDKFGLKYIEIQKLTRRWLDEVYYLRGVTPFLNCLSFRYCWMRSTI